MLRLRRPPPLTTPSPLAILADDFTGACDAAAPFAAAGLVTEVHLGLPAAWARDVAVLALDLDVRERSDAEAREAAFNAVRRLQATRVFVKIDSTLRGPIRGLVAGALEGSGRAMAVVAPAFPEQGRYLTGGQLRLADAPPAGTRLHEVLHARLVAAESTRSTEELDGAVAGARLVVIDSDDGTCLASVAAAWTRHPEWLLVGSSGLARRIARPAIVPHHPMARADGKILVVAGSPAEATQQQLAQLARLAAHPSVIVLASAPALIRDTGAAATVLANRLGGLERPLGMVVTGGQTARLVCQRLNVTGITLEGELQPGVPIGRLVGGAWHGVPVITKAGGFGGPDTLLDAVRALGVSSQEPT